MASHLFSSESVTEGHPDKLCDAVSDAVLDACLAEDPNSRVACETATKTGFVLLLGEITTKAKLDYNKIARNAIREIGFTSSDMGFDADSCGVMVAVAQQSPDIAQGVDRGTDPAKQGTVLYVTAEVIRQVAILAQPVIPTSAGKLLDLLAVPDDQRSFAALGGAHRLAPGSTLPAPSGVFPRYVDTEGSAEGGVKP